MRIGGERRTFHDAIASLLSAAKIVLVAPVSGQLLIRIVQLRAVDRDDANQSYANFKERVKTTMHPLRRNAQKNPLLPPKGHARIAA
ncbi:MAG: hypothetical protein ACREDT_14835 [Methylocella sp.]